ncbi:MAG: hypothetical protein NUK65_04690 [Firmicutes bacterium]|nr:hypothetical protein [Bacillota bacterium]
MKKRKPFTVIPGKKPKRTGEKVLSVLFAVAIGLLALQGVWTMARNLVAAVFVNTVVAQEGVLEQSVQAQGIIVREERVVASPLTGALRWQAEDEVRLAIGAPVATITTLGGVSQTVLMPGPGMVIRQLDGLEGILQPHILASPASIDFAKLRDAPETIVQTPDESEVQQGSLIFKVIDNYRWYYVAQFEQDHFTSLEGKNEAYLRFSFAPAEDVYAGIMHMQNDDDTITVSFSLQNDVAGCFTERFADAEIITQRTAGIVLPISALLVRGEDIGVYVVNQSRVQYRSVTVLQADSEQVVVRGMLTGLPVITNPSLVKEGQKL